MAKKTTVNIKKSKKSKKNNDKSIKNKNIHIKINIDQSKKTTGGIQPRKSNIKTLPAFNAIPSGGVNYVRQFTQDPYYTQSQNEHMNLLKQYNNLIKGGFKDVNKNDQQLIQNVRNEINDIKENDYRLIKDMNTQSVKKSYKDDEAFSLDGDESLTARLIEYEMNDDPETNRIPVNKLLQYDISPTLPVKDTEINDIKELKQYDKEPRESKIKLLTNDVSPTLPIKDTEIKDTDINDIQELNEFNKEQNMSQNSLTEYDRFNYLSDKIKKDLIMKKQNITDIEKIDDEIANAMKSGKKYLNGYRIYTKETMPKNKIFNSDTGGMVEIYDKNYAIASFPIRAGYHLDPYIINKKIQNIIGDPDEFSRKNKFWYKHRQQEEKDDDDDDVEEIDIRQIKKKPDAFPPNFDDNKSNSSSLSSRMRKLLLPAKVVTSEIVSDEKKQENLPIKFKPKPDQPKGPTTRAANQKKNPR